MRSARAALIVMARDPAAGPVKTRLQPAIPEAESTRLYRAFLADALRQFASLDVAVRVYVADTAQPRGLDVPLHGASLHGQRGSTLDRRMDAAFIDSSDAGYERLVIIGTDHPTLPTRYIRQAFSALGRSGSAVLGPCADGGFYLLGMNPYLEDLVLGRKYSHERVFEETLARARRLERRVTVLDGWYDVDTPADLIRLAEDLERAEADAPETRRVVADLARTYLRSHSHGVFTGK